MKNIKAFTIEELSDLVAVKIEKERERTKKMIHKIWKEYGENIEVDIALSELKELIKEKD